jgi:DNA-binding response OmpR family regulator
MELRSRQSYARRRTGLHAGHALAGSSDEGASTEIVLGDLRIELESMTVSVAGQPVRLTLQEFDLLVLLAREADRPVSQDWLAQAIWRETTPRRKRQISVLVARLRSKLSVSKSCRLLSVRKRGYGLMLADRSPSGSTGPPAVTRTLG